MTADFADRRKDSLLRSAINSIRDDLHKIAEPTEIYIRTLREICELTSSPLGFALEKTLDSANSPELKLICTFSAIEDLPAAKKENLVPLGVSTSDKAVRTLYSTLSYGVPRVIQGSEIKGLEKLIPTIPEIENMIAIPLSDGTSAFSLLCIANSKEGYHVELARRVWPLLTTCISVLRIMQSKQLQNFAQKRLLLEDDTWRENFSLVETLSPVAMITLNKEHEILRFNPAAEKIFGIMASEAFQRDISEFLPERFPNEHKTQTFTSGNLSHGHNIAIQSIGRSPKREKIPIELSVLHFQEYRQKRIVLLVRDRTEITTMRESLESELQRFRAVADLAPIGILQTDSSWHTVYANDRWLKISGMNEDELNELGWIGAIHEEDVEKTVADMHKQILENQEFQCECRFQPRDDKFVWVQLRARPLFTPDGDIHGFVATLIDTSYHHNTEERLRNLAERDALTGLANRMLFYDRLEHSLTRIGRHGAIALLCLDLDGFKNINDSLGHDAGDKLLVEIASRLKNCVREEDTVARVGGDEFTILLEGLEDASVAASVAEKILKALVKPTRISQQEVFISTSIGICFAVGEQKIDAKTLLKQADMALYRAKGAGRNNYQYYSPELEQASRTRLELGNSLHRALSRAEFEVFYQLQAEVSSNRVIGSEALLRWRHHNRGLLMPDEFIPLLDETGLISPVSRWVWHHAFMQHRAWIDQELMLPDACISVNVSARQFRDPLFLLGVEGAMADSGLSGENIIVEITESALIQDNSYTKDCLNKLKELGILIALDDFGTGYASLSYLKKFPIDILKIDRSFVQNLTSDKEDRAITQAVLALAASLDLSVFAEGVESKEILDLLTRWGCDYYQGFYLNKPSAAADVAVQLRSALKLVGNAHVLQ